jgi:hypothetical protein
MRSVPASRSKPIPAGSVRWCSRSFINGRGYRFTGNLHHTLTDTNERGETATWDFDLDPWAWRAGVGARFRWVPE